MRTDEERHSKVKRISVRVSVMKGDTRTHTHIGKTYGGCKRRSIWRVPTIKDIGGDNETEWECFNETVFVIVWIVRCSG